jgi:flavin-dependent dehydrogenase
MSFKTDYDVIIIGAGPASASCAMQLKKKNIKTLIIERKKLPRDKMCGGLLSQRTLDFLKYNFLEMPDDIICKNKMISIRISKRGYDFLDLQNSDCLHIYREKFDFWLINQTHSDILDCCTYLKHHFSDNHIKVFAKRNSKQLLLTCRFLIGADGSNSCIRHKIDPYYNQVDFLYIYQEKFLAKSNIDKSYCYFLFGKYFSPQYALFYCEDDLVCAVTSFYYKNKNEDYFQKLLNYLKEEFNLAIEKSIKKQAAFYDPRVLLSRFYFGENNVLLVGDASGLVSYLGEGIASALISGKLAAEAIIAHFTTNESAIDCYCKAIAREKDIILDNYKLFGVNPYEKK